MVSEADPAGLRIVVYSCHYCAYAAADLAGVLRLPYPAALRIIEIPCSGRFDLLEALHAFEHGADGVMVAGCLEGDCHFQAGNLIARRRVTQARRLLAEIGLEPERIEMTNVSSAMGQRFAQVANQMVERIQVLGPSPLRRPPG
ncbi:MAG: heterodisulfide reductase subunit MvhD [Chloroflexi bacterium RBG_13_68_17]|nr:MAG: heterodisulfide reductase subunit MvhD [Chloroflexi bacterium RBG_13_68_17]